MIDSSELTEEQRQIRETLRAFFEEVAPFEVVAEIDRSERYPAEILTKMGELGLWGLAVEERYGGNPADARTRCLIVEEIQRAGSTFGYAFIPTALFCAEAIGRFGTEQQRAELLPRLATGELRMAMSLSEPEAGSDLMGLSTRGVIEEDEIVISGQKIFTTGADTAELILMLVRTDRDAAPRSAMTFVLVPREAAGVAIQPIRKLAGQGTHTCEVFLDEVRIPRDMILGEVGGGTAIVMELLDADRIYTAAQSLGIAQGAFDLARRYAAERHQFGVPIIEHQAVGHMLADMWMRIEAARQITWSAAGLLDSGRPCRREAAMAKVVASEAGTQCALHGMQILGGYSYMVEYGMERFFREAKIQEIFGGTNQVLRNVLVRELSRLA